MAHLDFRDIHEPGAAANQGASRESEGRDRLEATLVDDTCTVLDAFTPLEVLGNDGVVLPALELLVRAQVRVRVVKADHKSNQDVVRGHVVQEGSAVHVRRHRPSGSTGMEWWEEQAEEQQQHVRTSKERRKRAQDGNTPTCSVKTQAPFPPSPQLAKLLHNPLVGTNKKKRREKKEGTIDGRIMGAEMEIR